jgi:hypothetical protein
MIPDREMQNKWIQMYIMPILLDGNIKRPIKRFLKRRKVSKKAEKELSLRQKVRKIYSKFCDGKITDREAYTFLEEIPGREYAPNKAYVDRTSDRIFLKNLGRTKYDDISDLRGNDPRVFIKWYYQKLYNLEKMQQEELELNLCALKGVCFRYFVDLAKTDLHKINRGKYNPLELRIVSDLGQHFLKRLIKEGLRHYCRKTPEERRLQELNEFAKRIGADKRETHNQQYGMLS